VLGKTASGPLTLQSRSSSVSGPACDERRMDFSLDCLRSLQTKDVGRASY